MFNSSFLPLPNGTKLMLCSKPECKEDFDEILQHTLHLVSLIEEKIEAYSIKLYHLPTQDYTPPSQKEWEKIKPLLKNEAVIAIHCHAGLGRTGTLAAMILIEQGMTAQNAIDHVRFYRKGAIETAIQESFLMNYSVKALDEKQNHL